MAEFEEVPSVAFGGWVVIGQPTSVDSFVVVGGTTNVYPTEGAAIAAAQAKITNPDNWYRTRVCPPTGPGFQDVE